MIILGVLLIALDLLVLNTGILYTLGIVLVIVGVILAVLSSTGRAFNGRRFY
ncbi:hypothetical protein BH23ACT9_BH23ACT9_20630 [soil metagenome]